MREVDSCGVGFICNVTGERSNLVVKWAIDAIKNLIHRGAISSDGKTGDGAGILFEIPRKFFSDYISRNGLKISNIDNLAVGFFYLWEDVRDYIEEIVCNSPFRIVGWREVPINPDFIGQAAIATMPKFYQLLLDTEGIKKDTVELQLFLLRRKIETVAELKDRLYIASLSSKKIVYKSMTLAYYIDSFWLDLKNEMIESSFCLFHQRYSTNTSPSWRLVQPFRCIAHNGEINTISANRNWIKSLRNFLKLDDIYFVDYLMDDESDSATLDRIFEVLCLCGFDPALAINVLMPPVENLPDFSEEVRGLLAFASTMMQPWDGPASVVFSYGDIVGAHLDRNGLRPARYVITDDGFVIFGSEEGIVDTGARRVVERGRLGPGDTIVVDLSKSKIKRTKEILEELANERSYNEWIKKNLKILECEPTNPLSIKVPPNVKEIATFFGYSSDDVKIILDMAIKSEEPIGSMGDDLPIPAFSEEPVTLYRYFKERFAQVTNPPIDPIREKFVMDLSMLLGPFDNFLELKEEHARKILIKSPILLPWEMEELCKQSYLRVGKISVCYSKDLSLEEALGKFFKDAYELISLNSLDILILSDRDVTPDNLAIPMLLAVSGLYNFLLDKGVAHRISLIAETGDIKTSHEVSCLIGYGARAVYPYLAYEIIYRNWEKGKIEKTPCEAIVGFKEALEKGILKILARMGISTLRSYFLGKLFDSICLNKDLVDKYFTGTPVTVEAHGISEIELMTRKRHDLAFGFEKSKKWLLKRSYVWPREAIAALHKFVETNDERYYREFSKIITSTHALIRDVFNFKGGESIPVTQVEPVESILRRFVVSAISLGAISPVAHETIAMAANILGMKSNCGEGGEDPLRYWIIKNSAIKQVASGRFGVTPTYLASAEEIEIKMAQGAKPGEGGHLPGHKVNEYIAKLRYVTPGTPLISPPPHHDIYSIEDLAQLINDLKEINPKAKIAVKLVAEYGIGVVATGVAKGYADVIHVSGCEGGTGASPLTSIRNAGNYWEIGLVEVQDALSAAGLRDKVVLRVDGAIRTGKDVVVAACLGAEEYGFGTVCMLVLGCVMCKMCHTNKCPVGIATQDPEYIKRFNGTVEALVAYFRAVAQEVREVLATLGVRTLDSIIGRRDLLVPENLGDKVKKIDTSKFVRVERTFGIPRNIFIRNENKERSQLARAIEEEIYPYVERRERVYREYTIRNVDRSIPVRLNYYIAFLYGDNGLPDDTILLKFLGTAGQSFGAFNHRGVTLTLVGTANDYVAKGMYGGRIILTPTDLEDTCNKVIAGNTCLYGATGGECYIAGRVGERFAVRNSGAIACVEGVGWHACEYMTRGTVVILGDFGYNLGAGMTGGVLYVLDLKDEIMKKVNHDYVEVTEPSVSDLEIIKSIVECHSLYTGSLWANHILSEYSKFSLYFKKIVPICKF